MRVLLVQPDSRTTRGLVAPPLGLMSIAPFVMDNGFEVRIYDANYEDGFSRYLKEYDPKIVGVNTITGPMLHSALGLSKLCKKVLGPKVKVVWGGIHASSLPEQVLQEDCVDFVVIGEGEFTFAELAELVRNGASPHEYRNVKGLAFREDGRVVINEKRELIRDLDALPFPAWDLLDAEKYLGYETPVITSRGCPAGCRFCYNRLFNRRLWRAMSVSRAVEYISYLKSLAPIKRLKFYDDNVAVNKKRFIEILSQAGRYPIFCEIRADYLTEGFVEFLPEYSSDPYVFVGVESASQEMLDYLNKGTTIEKIVEGFRLLNEHKVHSTASFMIGLPHQTREDVDRTVRFVSRLNPTRYTCCLYVPYPGCPLFTETVEEGLFSPPQSTEEWADLGSLESAEINVSDVDSEYLETVYRRMYVKSIWMFLKQGRLRALLAGAKNLLDCVQRKLFAQVEQETPGIK